MEYNYSNFSKCHCQINLTSVSVLCLFQLIIFSSLWVIFSYFFACLIIFDWIPDRVNFSFLSAWYFYVPKNFELCTKIHSIYLATIRFFRPCFNDLLGDTRAVLSVRVIIPHGWGKTVLCALPSVLGIMRVSSLACGNCTVPSPALINSVGSCSGFR